MTIPDDSGIAAISKITAVSPDSKVLMVTMHEDDPSHSEGALVAKLSEREKEILCFLTLGYTNLEIAETLSLSVRTVETYRRRLQQKVGLRSRADLVRLARQAGLVQ